MATVGELLADSLIAHGVRQYFTVPGESFLSLLAGLGRKGSASGIQLVTTRHEGGAGFMAEAHGQLTGLPAALLVTRAVGASNAAIAIHTARQNSTPMLIVVGQVPTKWHGREAFQETDLVQTIGGLAKWATELTVDADVGQLVEQLYAAATTGRPGPVLLSAPQDLLAGRGQPSSPTAVQPGPARGPTPSAGVPHERVAEALHRLSAASKPAIIAGAGVVRTGSVDRLVRLAEALEVPVYAAWRRPDAFPNDHRLYAGMSGVWASRGVREGLASSDAILAIGTRLSQMTSLGYTVPSPSALLIHVDNDPSYQHPRTMRFPVGARHFLDAVSASLDLAGERGGRERTAWTRKLRADHERDASLPQRVNGEWVHPAAVISAMQRRLPADAIVTTDAGNFTGWVERYLQMGRAGRLLAPTSGAMGYGLPAAIAASLHSPGRTVVTVCGDGGFAMTMNEIETAVRVGARPIALVMDNGMYGTIRSHAGTDEAAAETTDLGPWDFAAVATAAGALGITVSESKDVDAAIVHAMEQDLPAVIHLLCGPSTLAVP